MLKRGKLEKTMGGKSKGTHEEHKEGEEEVMVPKSISFLKHLNIRIG